MTILIVDDHALFRRAVQAILAGRFPGAAFGEAETAQAGMVLLRQSAWDILLLDNSMPGRSGLDMLKDIKEFWPQLPVLMLSSSPEEQYAMPALNAGAAGFLAKRKAHRELVPAVEKLLANSKYLSPSLIPEVHQVMSSSDGSSRAWQMISKSGAPSSPAR